MAKQATASCIGLAQSMHKLSTPNLACLLCWCVCVNNTALVAGAVAWVRGLMERLQEPLNKLLSMDRSVLELPAFRAAYEKCESVLAEMQQYEASLVGDWCSQVRKLCCCEC